MGYEYYNQRNCKAGRGFYRHGFDDINKKDKNISPSTRKRVLSIAKEHHMSPTMPQEAWSREKRIPSD
jgi:hypothetical protein